MITHVEATRERDAHRRRQGRHRHRVGQGHRQGHGAAPRQGRRARSSSPSGRPTSWRRRAPSSTTLGDHEPRRRLRHPASATRSTRWSRRRSSGFGRVDGLDQQRADVPAARADRRGERARRRRLLHSGVKGTLWAMQAVYPHMRDAGLGPHRQLRVVDGHHRRHRLRRVQRVEGSDPRAHAHRRARVGDRRHRRERDRAGRRRRTTARPASRARATASSSRTAR